MVWTYRLPALDTLFQLSTPNINRVYTIASNWKGCTYMDRSALSISCSLPLGVCVIFISVAIHSWPKSSMLSKRSSVHSITYSKRLSI